MQRVVRQSPTDGYRPRWHILRKLFTRKLYAETRPRLLSIVGLLLALGLLFPVRNVFSLNNLLSDGSTKMNLSVFTQCGQPLVGTMINEKRASPPCVYFHPSSYFSDPTQPGYQHMQLIETTASDVRFTMWGIQVNTFDNAAVNGLKGTQDSPSPNKSLLKLGVTSSVSCLMVPKVASRTVESLFLNKLSVSQSSGSRKNTWSGPRVGIATDVFWHELASRQKLTAHEKDIVFCLVRDPVARFLSSLAQTLSAPMQKKCTNCAKVLKPCLKKAGNSYQALLRCAIDSMVPRENPYFDVHMVPQATFLVGALKGNDVEVAVFYMDNGGLDTVLQAFGAMSDTHENKRESKDLDSDLEQRFGEQLLDPRKAMEALDKEMIHIICKLYEVDVNMLRYLGLPVTQCNKDGFTRGR